MIKVWIIVIVILNGGHAYEMERPYPTQEDCLDAAKAIHVGLSATVNCVPAYEK